MSLWFLTAMVAMNAQGTQGLQSKFDFKVMQ